MRDEECVQFLQWALPHLHMRWPGFRKVRNQVCKRIQRHIRQLDVDGVVAYRDYLEHHDDEWQVLDALCRVTISRFYRDKQMFAFLEQAVLPTLAERAIARGDTGLRVWSVGAGAGEEPYTVAIVWKLALQARYPALHLQVIATDADPGMLRRAQQACYEYGTVKNLPPAWRDRAFTLQAGRYCLKPEYREDVQFMLHDVRQPFPGDLGEHGIDLLLCRNLVFTYFDEALQCQLYNRILHTLRAGGALVTGIHEQLPCEAPGARPWNERLRIYEKAGVTGKQ